MKHTYNVRIRKPDLYHRDDVHTIIGTITGYGYIDHETRTFWYTTFDNVDAHGLHCVLNELEAHDCWDFQVTEDDQ